MKWSPFFRELEGEYSRDLFLSRHSRFCKFVCHLTIQNKRERLSMPITRTLTPTGCFFDQIIHILTARPHLFRLMQVQHQSARPSGMRVSAVRRSDARFTAPTAGTALIHAFRQPRQPQPQPQQPRPSSRQRPRQLQRPRPHRSTVLSLSGR